MTDQKLLVGLLGVIAVGVSFGLTVFLFGFVVLAGVLLVIAALVLLAVRGRRRTAVHILAAAGATLSGPLIDVGLAVLQSRL